MSIRVTAGWSSTKFIGNAQKAAEDAADAMFDELYGRYQAALGAKAWDWPNITIRSNGKPVGSPRDIVDTGTLRASGTRQMIGPDRCEFTWRTNYATAIHEGARLRNGGIIQPRPWTDVVNGTIQGAAKIKPYPAEQRFNVLFGAFFKD